MHHTLRKISVHLLRRLHFKLPGSQEPQHRKGVESLLEPLLLQHHAELVDRSILLFRGVARVARLRLRSCSRVVVVIVLGVEIHMRVLRHVGLLLTARSGSYVCCKKTVRW